MEAKLEKYEKKLSKSPYYAAAQIFNPVCRTGFLRDKDTGQLSEYGTERLFVVRKLWEKFRDERSKSGPALRSNTYDTQSKQSASDDVSPFFAMLQEQNVEYLRPGSRDEFEDYISEMGVPLPDTTTSIQWWSDIV